jgi:hypothetical protein
VGQRLKLVPQVERMMDALFDIGSDWLRTGGRLTQQAEDRMPLQQAAEKKMGL